MPEQETIGARIQRVMSGNGALGQLTYSQHQKLKLVTTEGELRAFLVDVGLLSRYRLPEPSPEKIQRAKMLLQGEVDEDDMLAAVMAVIIVT